MKAIFTKFLPATNYKGAMIVAHDMDGNRKTIGYEYGVSSDDAHDLAVIALCAKMKWTGKLVRGGCKHGNVYLWLEGSKPSLVIMPERVKA